MYLQRNMARKTNVVLLSFLAMLLQMSIAFAGLAPPTGYSVGFTGILRKGEQKYRCDRGNWVRTGSAGQVYSTDGSPLAKYWSTVNSGTGAVTYFWTITNSAGGYHESGSSSIRLQAAPVKTVTVSTSAIPEFLAIVKRRVGSGDAAMVAFVSLSGTKGGLPPRKALCGYTGATAGVPFSGTFRFYTQDLQPPTLPQSLTPKGSFVQAFFLEGKAVYKFVGNRWVYQGMYATIFTVAGGEVLGKFGTVTKPDRYSSKVLLKVNDPNGFWVFMQMSARPVRMSQEGCAWQLLRITTSGGLQSPSGAYRNAVIGATIGGTAPKVAAREYGITYGSSMSAVLYLFA